MVVTELTLPRLDGIGLLQALAVLPQPPSVVVCTAQADEALLARARELGAAETLACDVDPRVLAARLRAAAQAAA